MAVTDPEALRIRSYLQQQARERSIEELIGRVEEGVTELAAAAGAIPAADLDVAVANETWTPMDCIRHISGSNALIAAQILHVAHTGALPAENAALSAATREQLVAGMREAIDSLYAHARDADPAANLGTLWEHPFFGDLNWREWLLFLRIHSKDHARQLTTMSGALA